MPTALVESCFTCAKAWRVGVGTGCPAACCDNRESRHFRKFRTPHETCALWSPQKLEAAE